MMMRRFDLRVSTIVLTLGSALYAQAPNPPGEVAPPDDGAGATPAKTASEPSTPSSPNNPPTSPSGTPNPTAPDDVRAQPALPAAPSRRPARLGVRRTTPLQASQSSRALTPDAARESNDPSIDLHEPPLVPAAPIPGISAWLGFGNLWIPSEGLDPFSDDDALMTFSAGAALSLASASDLDIAAVAGFDSTSSDESYRGEDTTLGLLRFAIGPELRGSLLDRLYWHGRLSPTLTRLSAELDESSSDARLSNTLWVWGAEAAVGLELRFAEASTSLPRALAFFARVEAGYTWSPSTTLELEAGSGAPVRTAPLELGELALAGPLFRANVGIGF
jgi:hypothetical protein